MDKQAISDRLKRERQRLENLIAGDGIDNPARETETETVGELSSQDQHPADIASETFTRTKDLAILETIEAQLADLDHAEQRLEDGTYGTCEACGQPIGDERLEAMPGARFCVVDQQKVERAAGA